MNHTPKVRVLALRREKAEAKHDNGADAKAQQFAANHLETHRQRLEQARNLRNSIS